ncbi:MAG TPA: peptidylprolyl isomerase [Myxococcota bacterium]|nr:peptidylprolyl isomerase [Myxococcota bacterium]HRY93206.1 peptidylprolyl isomerase [Myxococcota bacterium]HSA22819.1 peptidylprolyl isomerase [Myxococcota bacterium]
MRLAGPIAALAATALLGAGCPSGGPPPQPAEEWPAVINGEPIRLAEFQAAFSGLVQAGKGFFSDPETARRVKRDLLERMIDERLLLQEARHRQVSVDPALAQASLELLGRQYPREVLAQDLKAGGRSLEQYRADTLATLTIQRLLKQEVLDRIAISREDVDGYYQLHKERFVRPEEVRVLQIVTRTEAEAEELRKQITQRGASFEELARKHSLGPEAARGGDLGFFPRGRMPPAIEEVAFKLWPGQVSKVTPSPYGFHLFKLVEQRPARALSLNDARQEIERTLIEERAKEAESFFVRTLREKATIERDLRLLDRIQ